VGGEARLRLSCGFGYAAGPAQEKGGAGLRGRGGKGRWASRMGQQAERARSRERGGRKEKFPSFFFLFFFFSFFSKVILQSHFQKILNSFSFSGKTTHHKSDYAAA
jgi:hypothetical protein